MKTPQNHGREIECPAGMTGLMVEPWTPGEVYAVAAKWAQASSPVYTWGRSSWDIQSHGMQVADFRHSPQRALKLEIEEAVRAGGDDLDEDEVRAIVRDARKIEND